MKKLFIVRHGNSSTKPGQSDFDRGLTNEGVSDLGLMTSELITRGGKIDYLLSSAAHRTTLTTQIINDVLELPEDKIKFKKELYLASSTTILSEIHSVPNSVNSLMIVAHNPGVTQFINYIANEFFDNIPTSGMTCITFDITSWSELENNGVLGFFIYPKMFKQ